MTSKGETLWSRAFQTILVGWQCFCDYHRIKGHKISSCWQHENIIQYLIKNGVIEVDNHQETSNSDHTIFKDTLHDRGMRKASSLGIKINDQTIYTHVYNKYIINNIQTLDENVNTITVKKPLECARLHKITNQRVLARCS